MDNQQNGTEGSLTITEPAPALSSTLQDVSSRVSVRGRDGLASLNSASVTVKGAVFLRVTDARGKVLAVFPRKERVIVEGVNVRKHHERKSQKNPEGSIAEREHSIHISNVMSAGRFDAKRSAKKA